MVYFIRSPAGPIKIGTTIRLSQRLANLRTQHGPGLEVLAVLDGSFEVEKALHVRFVHLRREKEWFDPDADLMAFIAAEGLPWDGQDEAGGVRLLRVDSEFARAVTLLARFSRQSVAEWLEENLLPTVLEKYDQAIEAELAHVTTRIKSRSA